MEFVINIIKELIAKEAARLVAYGSAAAIAGALALANLIGVQLTPDVIAGVGAIAAFIVTELIRRLVFSAASHEEDVAAAVEAALAAHNAEVEAGSAVH